MFSLQTKIKLYIVITIIINAVTTVAIFLQNIYLSETLTEALAGQPQIGEFLNKIYIFVIIVSLLSIGYGVYVFISIYLKGLNKYREILKRLNYLSNQDLFDLKSVRFPKEDEFGDIGVVFNSIVHKLIRFDDLKVQRIKVEQQKFEALAEKMDVPVLLVKVDKNDKIVKYYNSKFEHIFAKKRDKEDQYFDLRNFFLKALIIQEEKTVEKESSNPFKSVLEAFNAMQEGELIYSFIDKEFDEAIDIAIADRKVVNIKKDVRTIRGDEVWHSEDIEIIPAWNDYGQTLEVMIVFNKLRKK